MNNFYNKILTYLEELTSSVCRFGFTIEAAEYLIEGSDFIKVATFNPDGVMVKGSLYLIDMQKSLNTASREIRNNYFNLLKEGLLK